MAGRTWLLAGGLAALLSAPAGGAGATALVGLTADGLGGTLYDVDETSGAISNPRDVIGGLGGLTYLSTGELVATRHHSSGFGLYEVAQATGDTTLLVNFSNNVVEGGVAEDPDTGILYAVNMDPGPDVNGLFSIDIGAGTTTFIGSIYDTDGSGTGMDLSGLIFDLDGRLWALRDIGAIELVEIDPSDASVVSFLPITGGLPVSSALAGLALHPITGRLYLSYVSQLYDLDQSTGAATAIGGTGGETLAGLAWDPRVVPEPGTAGLLSLGIGALAMARRRSVDRSPDAPCARCCAGPLCLRTLARARDGGAPRRGGHSARRRALDRMGRVRRAGRARAAVVPRHSGRAAPDPSAGPSGRARPRRAPGRAGAPRGRRLHAAPLRLHPRLGRRRGRDRRSARYRALRAGRPLGRRGLRAGLRPPAPGPGRGRRRPGRGGARARRRGRAVAGAVLGGVAPARGDEAARGGVVELARRFAPLLGLAREPLARGLWLFVRSLHPFASTVFDLYLHTHPEGDQRVIRRPEMKAMFLDDLLSATQRQLHAPVFDLVLFTRPWGFSLRDIRVPIRFWHGDADHLVPLEHGVHQAALVPDAELIVRPGEGHLGNLDAADEIVDTLLELWPPAARPRVDPAPDAPEVPRVRDDDDRSAIEAPPARQGASSSRAR